MHHPGWKCCKPRVLTFDEFMSIPPCKTGKHSTIEDSPAPPADEATPEAKATPTPQPSAAPLPTPRLPKPAPAVAAQPVAESAPPLDEFESDDPDATIPANTTCRRRGCNVEFSTDGKSAPCLHHPGGPIFHEGSKGWSCCKRRVLEFDEFMNMPGCTTRERHSFTGQKKKTANGANGETAEELEQVKTVRHDMYQTGTTVTASLYLKKIDKTKSTVEFAAGGTDVVLDLKTTDGKEYKTEVPLYGTIVPEKSTFRILGTKLELTLVKASGAGWPVLRADEKDNGEIIQTGRAGRA